MFSSAAPIRATRQNRVRFVDEDAGVMRFSHVEQNLQIREITVHRINPLDDDELAFAWSPAQRFIQ